MTAHLFSPITLGALEFPNRIAVAPMCQYSADDGSATDWHLQQWMTYALSGAGMVTVEMTDVERRGRITHGCLGLYSDAQRSCRETRARRGKTSGDRRAPSSGSSWRMPAARPPTGGHGKAADRLAADEDPWPVVSASAIPYADGWQMPHALDRGRDRRRSSRNSSLAAKRAERAGFDFIELHSRAWLSAAAVPVAAVEPPHRQMGRLAGKPHAAVVEVAQADPAGGAQADARRAHLGHRLGRWRLHGRGRRSRLRGR